MSIYGSGFSLSIRDIRIKYTIENVEENREVLTRFSNSIFFKILGMVNMGGGIAIYHILTPLINK